MKNKESNKQNKKKSLILVLLLFVLVGIAGYGVYSYFYTSGSYSASSDVSIASFDPEIDGDFLGNGGTLSLTCPDDEDGTGTVECTGSLTVSNNGDTAITVATSNASVHLDELSHDDVTATAGTPVFAWENNETTIEAGSSRTLNVTVPVSLSSNFASGAGYERNSEYTGEAIGVTVSFKITATQVH